ncbi:MAG: FG-GAP-like repeat-containing protein, partial [Chitinophagales bacterium]|nr:FG-GAP-like repeat-containing protein [Chitinophagales bacterium]
MKKASLFYVFTFFAFAKLFSQPNFSNVASTAGVALSGQKDGGVAWCDFNNDGRLDLIVNTFNSTSKTRIYFQNSNNTFTDVTGSLFNSLSTTERSVVTGDIDNDGDNDFIVNTSPVLYVFKNSGSPNFTFSLHMTINPSWFTSRGGNGMNSEGLSLFDMEGDGDLDLLVENHEFGEEILLNDGNGNYSLYTINSNLRGLGNSGMGDYATTADFDGDGDIDLLLRRDGTTPNNEHQADLFINNGNGNFSRVNNPNHNAPNDNKGGVAFADFDNDGDFDIIYTDGGFPSDGSRTVIYEQTGTNSGNFSLANVVVTGSSSELPRTNSVDGIALGDVNHDGRIDLFLTNGSGTSFLLMNASNGQGDFRFSHANAGINVNADGEGASFADYDNDGDLDLYVSINNGNNQLWRNNFIGPGALSYLKVLPLISLGSGRSRVATGATAIVQNCSGQNVTGIQQVDGGSGHGSQMSPILHFGLINGRDSFYRVIVKFVKPNSGSQKVVTKIVRPRDLTNQLLVVYDTSESSPTSFVANAGQNQTRCNGNSIFTMSANSVNGTTGRWTLVSGTASIDNVNSPTTTVTVHPGNIAVLRWTLSNGCVSSSSTVTIHHSLNPNASLSGPDSICFGHSAVLTASGGTSYYWSTGDSSSSININTGGLYRVTVTNSAGCTASVSKTIVVTQPPTPANAGPDIYQCNNSLFLMSANNPMVGSGLWKVESGNATVVSPSSPTTIVQLTNGNAILRWITSNGVCPSSFDEVAIFNTPDTLRANAGSDIIRLKGDTIFDLKANNPGGSATGRWTLILGQANIISPSAYNSQVSVARGKQALLEWEIKNAGCISKDTLLIQHFAYTGCVAVNHGEWNNPVTWHGNCTGLNGYPGINDTAVISGKNIYVSTQSSCKELIINDDFGYSSLELKKNSLLRVAKNISFDVNQKNTSIINLDSASNLLLGGNIIRKNSPQRYGRIRSHEQAIIELNGSEPQIIPTTIDYEGEKVEIQNLVLNNTSEYFPAFIAEGKLEISNQLKMLKGCLDMGNDTLWIFNKDNFSVSGGNDSSFIIGEFCRHIRSDDKVYSWPIGKRDFQRIFTLDFKNNFLFGTNYICVQFVDIPEDSRHGIDYTENNIHLASLAVEGIWRVEPDIAPSRGSYDIYVKTSNFSNLSDNEFLLLKRRTGSGVEGWGNGGGVHPDLNDSLRKISTGYTALKNLTSFSEFGIGRGGGGLLPVKLSSFKAIPVEGKIIRLIWITESEVNNLGFEIQRSENGKEYYGIGWEHGKLNSTETNYYAFNDYNVLPELTYYYRLKQID